MSAIVLMSCVSVFLAAAHGSSDYSLDPSAFASNPAQARVDCGETLFTWNHGQVVSPTINFTFTGYITCHYVIQTTPGTIIMLNSILINIHNSTECKDNYLRVTDLEDHTDLCSYELPCFQGRMCGQSSSLESFWSSGNVVLVEFRRNDTSDQSFDISYDAFGGDTSLPAQATVDCGKTSFTEDYGTVTSPEIVSNFTGFISCIYTIQTLPGHKIDLFFVNLGTEISTDCEDNYLKITDVEFSQNLCFPVLPCSGGRMCGYSGKDSLRSFGNVVRLEFRRNNTDQSFEIDYQAVGVPVLGRPPPFTGDYRDLHHKLHDTFSKVLPIGEHNLPVEVDLKLTLKHILEVNTQYNRVTVVVWKHESWVDATLGWPLHDYSLTSVGMRASKLWSPDVVPYNLLSKHELLTPQTVTIEHTGRVVSVQAVKLSVDCDTEGHDTYSGAVCQLKMGSWTYNARLVQFVNPSDDSMNIADFSPTSRYEITSHSAQKLTQVTPGLPEPFSAVLFTFGFRVKGTYLQP